jgi:hypothetical protein
LPKNFFLSPDYLPSIFSTSVIISSYILFLDWVMITLTDCQKFGVPTATIYFYESSKVAQFLVGTSLKVIFTQNRTKKSKFKWNKKETLKWDRQIIQIKPLLESFLTNHLTKSSDILNFNLLPLTWLWWRENRRLFNFKSSHPKKIGFSNIYAKLLFPIYFIGII